MLDSVYHILKSYFGVKTLGLAICVTLKASFYNVSCLSANH